MKIFHEWFLLQLVESDDQLISGDGIDMLKRTMLDMANRGAPKEYNDFGFNKMDWDSYTQLVHYLNQPAIPAWVAPFQIILNQFHELLCNQYLLDDLY